jgi:hypothetical protein
LLASSPSLALLSGMKKSRNCGKRKKKEKEKREKREEKMKRKRKRKRRIRKNCSNKSL